MNELLYCIEHQRMEMARGSELGLYHEVDVYFDDYPYYELDWCFFEQGYAYCEPPEYDPDWQLNLIEPEESELEDYHEIENY